MEYKEFAEYYDIFYQKKNYEGEVNWLLNFINKQDKIIDIGCGTGIHASLIANKGFDVEGLDASAEMLKIAKTRLSGNLYLQNILNINIDKKYDVVISMFAVLNHLKDTDELEKALLNLRNILQDDGIIIIDLHNPQKSGSKVDSYENMSRTMEWDYDRNLRIEKSKIIFQINNNKYIHYHTFRIFSINEVEKCCNNVGLKVEAVYENYNINKKGTEISKNLQFVIRKISW